MDQMFLAEELNPLLPVASEIIVGTIAFGVVFFVIWKFIVPRFEQAYAERTEAIEGGIAKAEIAQAEAATALETLPGSARRCSRRSFANSRRGARAGCRHPRRDA